MWTGPLNQILTKIHNGSGILSQFSLLANKSFPDLVDLADFEWWCVMDKVTWPITKLFFYLKWAKLTECISDWHAVISNYKKQVEWLGWEFQNFLQWFWSFILTNKTNFGPNQLGSLRTHFTHPAQLTNYGLLWISISFIFNIVAIDSLLHTDFHLINLKCF